MLRSRQKELDKMVGDSRNAAHLSTGEANAFMGLNELGKENSTDLLNKSQVIPKNVLRQVPRRSLERELLEKRINQIEEPNSESSSDDDDSASGAKLPDDRPLNPEEQKALHKR